MSLVCIVKLPEESCHLLQDLQVIYYGLQGMEALSPYRDSVLRSIAKTARYERHEANDVLY
jgi:Rap guanine nucleotide exchange factor 2